MNWNADRRVRVIRPRQKHDRLTHHEHADSAVRAPIHLGNPPSNRARHQPLVFGVWCLVFFPYSPAAMSPSDNYLVQCRGLIDAVAAQRAAIERAADWFAETILAGRMVHLFGSGHSRILVEEMWPRYGSFPGFNPIVELSLSFHNLVVGPNGQRQAMFLENVSGLAERILRNFDLSPQDCALVASSGGCNVVPIEMAQQQVAIVNPSFEANTVSGGLPTGWSGGGDFGPGNVGAVAPNANQFPSGVPNGSNAGYILVDANNFRITQYSRQNIRR